MSMDRRSFLQMLGIGGMGLVVGDAVAPLFSSPDVTVEPAKKTAKSSIWMPGDDAVVSDDHLVITYSMGWSNGDTPIQLCTNEIHKASSVEEAHTAFFMAATAIRRRFAALTLENLKKYKDAHPYQTGRGGVTTVVRNPIHAVPSYYIYRDGVLRDMNDCGFDGVDDNSNDGAGFKVLCNYDQRYDGSSPYDTFYSREADEDYIPVVGRSLVTGRNVRSGLVRTSSQDHNVLRRATHDNQNAVISRNGQFPIDVPNEIDIRLLIKVDQKIVEAQESNYDSVRHFVRKFLST